MKKVLITGASGFLGMEMISLLDNIGGYEIKGLDIVSKDPRIETCNILDSKTLEEKVTNFQPRIVYHLAGLFNHPNFNQVLALNIGGTENIMNACSKLKNQVRVVFASTCAVYGIPEINPVKEAESIKPINNYGISKYSAELILKKYTLTNDHLTGVSARIYNLYGRGMSEKLFAGRISKYIANQDENSEALLLGGVDSKRDYIHISDCSKALSLLGEKELTSEVYNVGSGEQVSIKAFLEEVKKHHKDFKYLPDQFPPFKNEVKEICADMSQFFLDCGWEPNVSLEEGIRLTYGIGV